MKKILQKNEQNVKMRFFVFNKNLISRPQAQPDRRTSYPLLRTESERNQIVEHHTRCSAQSLKDRSVQTEPSFSADKR